eukprot:3954393-Pyramimonas_sp.AAC.1
MVGNLTLNYGGSVPAQGLFGFMPKGAYDPESKTLTSANSIIEQVPDYTEAHLRLRLIAKASMLQAIVEERLARATNTRQQSFDT